MPDAAIVSSQYVLDKVRRFHVSASQDVARYDLVRMEGLTDSGVYMNATKATGGGTGAVFAAMAPSARGYVTVTSLCVIPFDTAGTTKGDPVYISESVAGSLSLSPGTHGEVCGVVGVVGTVEEGGKVLFCYGDLSVASTVAPHDLTDHRDVNITTVVDGEVLTYDSGTGNWTAKALPSYDLDSLTDVDVATAVDGEVLTYDSGTGNWVNAAHSVDMGIGDLNDVTVQDLFVGGMVEYQGPEWEVRVDRQPDRGVPRATLAYIPEVQGFGVWVNNTYGSDVTGTGAYANPFASISRALMALPHIREQADRQRIWVGLQESASVYELPYGLQGQNNIGIVGSLPDPDYQTNITGTRESPGSDGALSYFTDLSYGSPDEYLGYLLITQNGVAGVVGASGEDVPGGLGHAYVQMASYLRPVVSTSTPADMYAPSSLVRVATAGAATGDEFTVTACDVEFQTVAFFDAATPSEASIRLERSRVVMRRVCLGTQVDQVLVDSQSLLRLEDTSLTSDRVNYSTAILDSYGNLELAGVMWGSTLTTTNRRPAGLRRGSVTNFEGVSHLSGGRTFLVDSAATVGNFHRTMATSGSGGQWLTTTGHNGSLFEIGRSFSTGNIGSVGEPPTIICLPSFNKATGGGFSMVEVSSPAKVYLSPDSRELGGSVPGGWSYLYTYLGSRRLSGDGRTGGYIRIAPYADESGQVPYTDITASATLNWDGEKVRIVNLKGPVEFNATLTLDKLPRWEKVTLVLTRDPTNQINLTLAVTGGSIIRRDAGKTAAAEVYLSEWVAAGGTTILDLLYNGTDLYVLDYIDTTQGVTGRGWLTPALAQPDRPVD